MKLTWYKLLPECQSMTNVSLVCEDGVVTSHKIIVAGISEFIRGLMEEAIPSNDPVTIIMPDFETIIVERMIGDVLTKDAASNSGIEQAFKIQSYDTSVTLKPEDDSVEEMSFSLEEEAVNTTFSEIIEYDVLDDVEDKEGIVEDIPVFNQVGDGQYLGKEIKKNLGTDSISRLKTSFRGASTGGAGWRRKYALLPVLKQVTKAMEDEKLSFSNLKFSTMVFSPLIVDGTITLDSTMSSKRHADKANDLKTRIQTILTKFQRTFILPPNFCPPGDHAEVEATLVTIAELNTEYDGNPRLFKRKSLKLGSALHSGTQL